MSIYIPGPQPAKPSEVARATLKVIGRCAAAALGGAGLIAFVISFSAALAVTGDVVRTALAGG